MIRNPAHKQRGVVSDNATTLADVIRRVERSDEVTQLKKRDLTFIAAASFDVARDFAVANGMDRSDFYGNWRHITDARHFVNVRYGTTIWVVGEIDSVVASEIHICKVLREATIKYASPCERVAELSRD